MDSESTPTIQEAEPMKEQQQTDQPPAQQVSIIFHIKYSF